MREVWYICDNLHIGYNDVLDMSFQERFYLVELINEKKEETQKALEAREQERQNRRRR